MDASNPDSLYLRAIERELQSLTQSTDPLYTPLFDMFQYHLGWKNERGEPQLTDTGKRLRPLLCLWTCEALGGDWHTALPAAAAIELIHNFSLIHDDIEDNSAERRGRRAVWQVWGLAQGLNAGDAMFVLAHLALGRLAPLVPPDVYTQVRAQFDEATLALTRGQFLDLYFERADQVNTDAYLEMVRGKTAALIQAASAIGACIATRDAAVIDAFARYGQELGIAFQVADDVLGIWGNPAETGKSADADLLSRKKSYPVLAALESDGDGVLARLYRQAEWSAADLARVREQLTVHQMRDKALALSHTHAQLALDALNSTGRSGPAVDRLKALVSRVVDRQK